jgi:hypothetical protein
MAEAFIADGGSWKKASQALVADGGGWTLSDSAKIADGGVWKEAYSGDPEVTITASGSSDAPWSRITYSVSATGTFDPGSVRVVLRQVLSNGATITTIEKYLDDGASNGTVTYSAETAKLIPKEHYKVAVEYDRPGGQSREWHEIASSPVVLAKPPFPKNASVKTPLTDVAGGVQWVSSRDVDDWNSRNNTLGTEWHHNGDKSYIYYSSGLKPSTLYRVQSRSKVNGVYGDWSGEMSWKTTAPQYTPGSYYFWPGLIDIYDRYGWQKSSRSYYYHGYYSSNRSTQRCCLFFDPRNSTITTLRSAINKGARVIGAWILMARPSTANGSYAAVTPLIAKMQCAYPNAPVALSGNAAGTPGLSRDNISRSVTTTDGGATLRAWVREMIVGNGSITGFMLGNSSNSAYYMSLHKANMGRIRVDIA